MEQLNIADAKANFSKLVDKALLGKEIINCQGQQPPG